MTNPSDPYEGLTPQKHEDPEQITDTEVNEALEHGDTDLPTDEILHDEAARPDSEPTGPQPPSKEA
jgi:hypothetical protein